VSDRPVRSGSLRRRVIVSVLGLLLLVFLAMGLVVNVVLGDRLRADLRQRVADRALFVAALSGQQLTPQQLTDRLTGQGITATYRSGSQVVVGRDQPPPTGAGRGVPGFPGQSQGQPPTSPTDRATQPSLPITVERTGELLEAKVAVETTSGSGTVTLSANLVEIDRTMATLTRVELAAGAATLALAMLLLAVVVRLALAPLGKMTSLAHRIRAGARGGRLRPTKPQTDLGRTATAFDGMLDALEQAEVEAQGAEARMRSFLADASHDLRTPIAGVISTAERLLQDSHSRAEREQRLVSLIREARRAGRLVDDLLLMTRLDTGGNYAPVRLEAVDLGPLIDAAVERTSLLASGRSVIANVDESSWANCDRDSIERILANVLDNARAATGPGDQIALRSWVEDGVVLVEVADTGPGVPSADQQRIFDRFVRLDSARTRGPDVGGAGLGLPIAKALAEEMGGDLVCRPSPIGAVFRLSMPPVQRPVQCRPAIPLGPPSPLPMGLCPAPRMVSGSPAEVSRHLPV
jgi:two-component system OmpR family sensor kinase